MKNKEIIYLKGWINKPQQLTFIYCWENLINNKKYIGQTTQGQKRLYDEISGHGIGPLFKNAIKKYQKDAFICYILEYCPLEQLNEREIYWIKYFNSADRNYGYNIASGGFNFHKILSIPIEKRDINSNEIIAIYYSLYDAAQEFINRDVYINRIEDNIRKALCGDLLTAYRYKWTYQGHQLDINKQWQRVAQYDLQGNFIKEYANIKIAAESNNINYKNLWSSIKRNNICLQCGGYMWRKIMDWEEPLESIAPYINQLPYKIVEYDLNDNIIEEFVSIQEASEKSGDSRTRISLCCNGHQESTHKHKWKKIFNKELE